VTAIAWPAVRRHWRAASRAAEASDPDTHRFWAQLYSEERVSGAYSELSGKRPRTDALPVLTPEQVVRRARSAAPAGEPAACTAVA
jgi:HEPN domain-containing protein